MSSGSHETGSTAKKVTASDSAKPGSHIHILLSRLLYITEGKYGNQLEKIRKFRYGLSSGSHETGSTAKKVTASDSAKPGPHIHVFFLSQGLRVRVGCFLYMGHLCFLIFVEIGGGSWGLELNFLGFQIEENFWEAKFEVFI